MMSDFHVYIQGYDLTLQLGYLLLLNILGGFGTKVVEELALFTTLTMRITAHSDRRAA